MTSLAFDTDNAGFYQSSDYSPQPVRDPDHLLLMVSILAPLSVTLWAAIVWWGCRFLGALLA